MYASRPTCPYADPMKAADAVVSDQGDVQLAMEEMSKMELEFGVGEKAVFA